MRKVAIQDEIELMEGFRLGREESSYAIFHQLFASLTLYALHITSEQPVAEDIAEEALVKAWEHRAIFFKFTVLKSWLYTTVRNSSISWLRQHDFHDRVKKDIAYTSPQASGYVLADMIKAEVLGQMKVHFDALPFKSKTVLHKVFFEGKKIPQIAAELGLSECTVKNHKSKGLRELKKQLGGG